MSERLIKKAEIGDVVMSPDFVAGLKSPDGSVFVTSELSRECSGPNERRSFKARIYENGKWIKKDFLSYDPTRLTAKFVVEEAFEIPGDEYQLYSKYFYFPGGWGVFARRLNSEGLYDPNGERIFFNQSYYYYHRDSTKEVTIVGKMRMTFV